MFWPIFSLEPITPEIDQSGSVIVLHGARATGTEALDSVGRHGARPRSGLDHNLSWIEWAGHWDSKTWPKIENKRSFQILYWLTASRQPAPLTDRSLAEISPRSMYSLTMPPIIPCHKGNKLNSGIQISVMGAINAKKPVPKASESVQLKSCLDDYNEKISL
jgi:hypothetical protein